MTTAERSFFFKQLEEFQEDRGEDSGPPLFAKKAVDQWKLWVAVQEAGGFNEVTATKGWARIGRLFDPPRTMTDLSFRIKKIYEVHLLPFERVLKELNCRICDDSIVDGLQNAVDEGRLPGVYQPPRVAPQTSGLSRGGPRPAKRANTGRTTPTPNTRPKRQRKEGGHMRKDAHLIGKVVKIFWPKEQKYFRGTVTGFESDCGMHKVLYDDGDEDLLDLSDHDWVLDGPDTDLVDTSRLMRLRDDLNALDDEDDELFGNESECEDLGPPKSRDSLPKDCIEDRVHANRGYKVYIAEDTKNYEVFCLIPKLALEGVRVKAWETGKVLVKHLVKTGSSPLSTINTAFRIRLPTSINAPATQAIITLHQQLYLRVPIKGDLKMPKNGAIPPGESAVQALPSETLEQEVDPSPDDEAAISPDRSNMAISPEKLATQEQERQPERKIEQPILRHEPENPAIRTSQAGVNPLINSLTAQMGTRPQPIPLDHQSIARMSQPLGTHPHQSIPTHPNHPNQPLTTHHNQSIPNQPISSHQNQPISSHPNQPIPSHASQPVGPHTMSHMSMSQQISQQMGSHPMNIAGRSQPVAAHPMNNGGPYNPHAQSEKLDMNSHNPQALAARGGYGGQQMGMMNPVMARQNDMMNGGNSDHMTHPQIRPTFHPQYQQRQ